MGHPKKIRIRPSQSAVQARVHWFMASACLTMLTSCQYMGYKPSPFEHAINRVIANQPLPEHRDDTPKKPGGLSSTGLIVR
jgi:hypothetical protein